MALSKINANMITGANVYNADFTLVGNVWHLSADITGAPPQFELIVQITASSYNNQKISLNGALMPLKKDANTDLMSNDVIASEENPLTAIIIIDEELQTAFFTVSADNRIRYEKTTFERMMIDNFNPYK